MYVGEKLQEVINTFETAKTGVSSELTFNQHDAAHELIRDNAKFIIDEFMEKYVNSINVQDISKDDESHDEQNMSDAVGNQMRGFELISKILDLITLEDWHKVQRNMGYKHIYHYQKSELIDLDINAQISEAIKIINENNFNQIALTTNEKSQLQGLINIPDIITFLVNNYKGDLDFYVHPFSIF